MLSFDKFALKIGVFHMSATLSAVLRPLGPDYKDLFKPGKVLQKRSGCWVLTCARVSEKDKLTYFSSLMEKLYEESSLEGINGECLARKINEFVFKEVRPFEVLPVIGFKSSSPSYSFLSNFSPTAIYVRGKFFPDAEVAYQSLVANEIDLRASRHEFSRLPDSALSAKHIGRKIERLSGKHLRPSEKEDLKSRKLEIMGEVIEAKFSQNCYLAKALVATRSAELKEDTTDSLFAGKEGCEDLLGKILARVRASLGRI
jgi:predicted NAD-dependent protein-ADP-ribosyltransferase YbiA (DUF1768 family)